MKKITLVIALTLFALAPALQASGDKGNGKSTAKSSGCGACCSEAQTSAAGHKIAGAKSGACCATKGQWAKRANRLDVKGATLLAMR